MTSKPPKNTAKPSRRSTLKLVRHNPEMVGPEAAIADLDRTIAERSRLPPGPRPMVHGRY